VKILLFGKDGQVGWELQRALSPLGEMVALGRAGEGGAGDGGAGGLCGDFTNPEGLADTVRRLAPDVIVNAAAYTAVDKAESEPEQARLVNARAPGILARVAVGVGAWLVHYSTDYVFDGGGARAWREHDPTAPLNVYGLTKLEGEQAIRAAGGRHLILRTSWVYGARGGNFARTMLRLARERDRLTVIDDQIGAPTGADLLADVTAHLVRAAHRRPEVGGLYHLVAAGETSWHGYARFVLEYAGRAGVPLKAGADAVAPIPTSDFPTPARRPHNSRLDTTRVREVFDLTLPPWQTGVARMLTEILEK
jgi:dTDP-4-dehydrorhamnose reductase